MSPVIIKRNAWRLLLSGFVAFLLAASMATSAFAANTKVTRVANTKMASTIAAMYKCGSLEGEVAVVYFWYCWNDPQDANQDYSYSAWEGYVDVPCWTPSTGLAQRGTGPAYWNLVEEAGPPTPECPGQR
jgi:hypothetical protein